jgi:hypothetical protein
MDPQVSTSFIPKKNFDTGSSRSGGSGGVGLLVLLSILIFVAALALAGGIFAYQKLLTQSIASKSASLKANEDAYNLTVIQELVRADSRINEAEVLLNKHVAPSEIFSFLSLQTLEKVQFTSFEYSLKADGTTDINLKGLADSFSTIALQSDQFGASKILKDVVFSEVNLDSTTGKVTFSVAATVAPSLILYTNALSGSMATPIDMPTDTEAGTTTTQ